MEDNLFLIEDETIQKALAAVGNLSTRLGTVRDPSSNMVINDVHPLSIEAVYKLVENSELLNNIVTAYPVDGLRLSPVWNVTDTSIESGDIAEYFNSLKFVDIADECYKGREAVKQAQIVANIEGNAYLWVNLDDGLEPSEPIDFNRIRSIKESVILGSRDVSYSEEIKKNGFLMGGTYQITAKSEVVTVHRTRIIRFEGSKSTGDRLRQRNFKNLSRLQSVYDSFSKMSGMQSSIGNYIQTASLFTYKMKDLATKTFTNKKEELIARFSIFVQSISSIGGLVMDKDGEEIEFINRNFSGLEPLFEQTVDQFIASSGLTRGRLFKVSSQGAMSESGKSDDRQWGSMVANYQSDVLTVKLSQLTDIILAAKDGPTRGVIIPYSISYPSILPEDNKAKAETYKLISEGDKNYKEMGLKGETIISSRFKSTEFGQSITLDDDYMEEEEQTATIESQQTKEKPIEDSSDKIQIPTWEQPMTDTDYDSILALLESGNDID